MNNFIQAGKNLTVPAPTGGTVSGQLYRILSLLGVAATTEAVGDPVVLITDGVFDLAKTSAQAWAVGDPIYSIAATNVLTNVPGTGNFLVGVAVEIAANPSAIGRVRLNGSLGHLVTA